MVGTPAFRVSGGQLLAALGAAVCQDLATANGLHAGAKSVPALADQLGRLIGALHDTLRNLSNGDPAWPVPLHAYRRVHLNRRPVESGGLYGHPPLSSISAAGDDQVCAGSACKGAWLGAAQGHPACCNRGRNVLQGIMTVDVSKPFEQPTERDVAFAFLRKLAGTYDVAEAILFGSRARGDHRPDSDLDLAIVLHGRRGDFIETKLDMAGIAFDALLETGVLVQPFPLWDGDLAHPDRFTNPSLIHNISQAGVRLPGIRLG